jgi:hypothetical protein
MGAVIVPILINLLSQNHKVKSRTVLIFLCPTMVAYLVLVIISIPPETPSVDLTPHDDPPAGWRTVGQQSYDMPDGPAFPDFTAKGSCTKASGTYASQRLVMRLDSCDNYTFQSSYTPGAPPATGTSYYFKADVQFLSGPTDAYCALLFGWTADEHWYAFKLGDASYEITRDPGQLPHDRMAGPAPSPAIKADASNRLTIISDGRNTRFYINGVRVSEQPVAAAGMNRIGIQAANYHDVAQCSFDNVELREP